MTEQTIWKSLTESYTIIAHANTNERYLKNRNPSFNLNDPQCFLWSVWSKGINHCKRSSFSVDGSWLVRQWVRPAYPLAFLFRLWTPRFCVRASVHTVLQSYPVDCRPCGFWPAQKLSVPTPPLFHFLASPVLSPCFLFPPRTLCGADCALSDVRTKRGDWVLRCTLRYPFCWPRLERQTSLGGNCSSAETEKNMKMIWGYMWVQLLL